MLKTPRKSWSKRRSREE